MSFTVALSGPYYYVLGAIDGPHLSLKQHTDHRRCDSAASLVACKYNIDYQYVLKVKQSIYTSTICTIASIFTMCTHVDF